MMPFERFRALFDDHTDFAIVSHVDPDGDAIGSSLGLAWALRNMGRGAIVVNESSVPLTLKFLPGAETIRRPADITTTWQTVIVLDCASFERLGPNTAKLVVS